MKNTEIFVSFFLQQICKQPSMQFSQDIYTEPFNPQKDNLKQIAHYFQISLHHPPSIVSDQQIMSQTINSTKSNTILMDVLRTRSTVFTKQERTQMQKMLHHFCRLSKLEYKQGLNQILAPFELFRRAGYTISQCYALFKAFFDTYCLNFYYDKDFNSLEIIFRMVSVVIKYHDPALARYLENYQIEPQIYCISWLMTLFSSKLSFKLTYVLWQFLTTEKDDYLIFFLIVAIIIMRKEEIIQTKQSSIFSIITNLIFRKEQELKHTIKVALLLRRSTPASLILFFKETKIFREKKNFSRISDLLTQINKINVFLVGSGQISLRQHLNLGLCDSHCYFCSIRQPLKLAATQHQMKQYFPNVYSLVNISNDLRTMNFEIDFVIIDIRGNKQRQLPSIKGLNIYKIDINTSLSKVQAQFNEQFIQFKGKQHFLFLLNQFSFEQLQKIKSKELQFSTMLIKILNSYSYNYLSILQGGQDAYFDFLRTNKMKSQIINSKLVPVSEYIDDGDMINTPETFVGMQDHLKPSQIINIQYLYDNRKIEIFEGAQGSENNYLLILQGLIVIIQRTKQIQRLFKQVKQKKSALSFLIEQQWTAEIPLKIVHLHSIYLMDKLTVRLHHNNCLIIYLKQSSQENDKNYRSGFRAKLWRTSVDNIVKQDLQKQHFQVKLKRINFDTQGFEAVKQISQIVKENYKEMVRVKRMIEQSQQRNQNLNNNVIDQNQFQTGLPSQH